MGGCPLVELRRYRLRPGRREALIDLFEREFIETQEAAGMRVIGQFRDLDQPDHFVWLRGFVGMEDRARALERFYTGPVWARHRDAANATMVNSDNVLLLRAVEGGGFAPPASRAHWPRQASGLVVATICSLAPRTETGFATFFADQVRPLLERTGARVLAALVAEHGANTFPRLPVREGETVFVWFSGFASPAAYETHRAALAALPAWSDEVFPAMDARLWRAADVSRLAPTARSLLQA